jgi:hypothetical protein
MTAQVLNGNAAWDFLDRDWPRLYEADPTATPYQSATWLSAWATHLDATATPLVLSMPGAALALVRRPEPDGTQRLAPLSAPHAEYVGPVGPQPKTPPPPPTSPPTWNNWPTTTATSSNSRTSRQRAPGPSPLPTAPVGVASPLRARTSYA